MEIYQVENLTYYYPEKENPALMGVNLEIREGEFVLLTGSSGCGKSSLLRALAGLLPDYYGGSMGGEVRFGGRSLSLWDKRQLARNVGLVFQDPEQQLVMTSVEQEIAFGLENLGIEHQEMRRRVAEVLSLFDLTELRNRSIFTLSGGQKQKVVLASILAMYPRVLLLDEPTSQLDPVAAQELLNYIQRLNLEWGLTMVLVEQRTDRCFHLADRVMLMEEGKLLHQGAPQEMAHWDHGRFRCFMPPVAQVFSALDMGGIPLTIKEGRKLLQQHGLKTLGVLDMESVRSEEGKPEVADSGEAAKPQVQGESARTTNPGHGDSFAYSSSGPGGEGRDHQRKAVPLDALRPSQGASSSERVLLQIKDLEYAYDNRGPCLRGINLTLYPGEITVVLGENGAGKSTLLKTINGLLRPQRGKVFLEDRDITHQRAETLAEQIGYLSQDPNDYLFHDTVRDEIAYGLKVQGREDSGRVEEVLELLEIARLANDHPRDSSGGERQRIALGAVMVTDPLLLLLDEPTRGLDLVMKRHLAELLRGFRDQGKAVVVVTHDVEFAAEVAGRVVILSGGQVVAYGGREEVLSNSLYYAPQVNRLFRGLAREILTVKEAVQKLNARVHGVS